MKLLQYIDQEIRILKIELKDAIVSSHKDEIITKLDALYTVKELYKEA